MDDVGVSLLGSKVPRVHFKPFELFYYKVYRRARLFCSDSISFMCLGAHPVQFFALSLSGEVEKPAPAQKREMG